MRQVAIAVVILGFLAIAIAVLTRRGPRGAERVAPALRPGPSDDVLEDERLTKTMRWGVVIVLFFAIFLPIYWFAEPGRMDAKTKAFEEESISRGKAYYALRVDQETGEENHEGVECARCHGSEAQGGETQFLDPNSGQVRNVKVPSLFDVFARYETAPPGFKDARAFILETIERGRPGTAMPTWGNENGGPLTEQQIDDIINYLYAIQHAPEVKAQATGADIFSQNCSPCHGIGGTGGAGPAMVNGAVAAQFPTIEDHIAFVKAGSKQGVKYGTNGKGTGGMPAWGKLLTDAQIQLVVEYERSL
ncbi:MAG TPA: c-type cytochrome [Actinomycetota bacterium]|nr:c-type cytochrome [Actinomycetota bacterium]